MSENITPRGLSERDTETIRLAMVMLGRDMPDTYKLGILLIGLLAQIAPTMVTMGEPTAELRRRMLAIGQDAINSWVFNGSPRFDRSGTRIVKTTPQGTGVPQRLRELPFKRLKEIVESWRSVAVTEREVLNEPVRASLLESCANDLASAIEGWADD